MNIKTGIIQRAFKKEAALLNKGEIFFKTEIGDGIVNEQQTETGDRHPEKHLKKYPGALPECVDSGVKHTDGCVTGRCGRGKLSIMGPCYKFVKGIACRF